MCTTRFPPAKCRGRALRRHDDRPATALAKSGGSVVLDPGLQVLDLDLIPVIGQYCLQHLPLPALINPIIHRRLGHFDLVRSPQDVQHLVDSQHSL